MREAELVELITERVLEELCISCGFCATRSCSTVRACDLVAQRHKVPVGISARHIHITPEHLEVLFGEGAQLTHHVDLYQPGNFAAKETVTIVGPRGAIERVRILGPLRDYTQVELARTDAVRLGLDPPVRDSGDLDDAAPITIVGPKGSIFLEHGAIIAARHIHMPVEDAERMGLTSQDLVSVRVPGERGLTFENVRLKIGENVLLQLHLDTDEGNAAGLQGGEAVEIILPDGSIFSPSEEVVVEEREPIVETVEFKPEGQRGKPVVTASFIESLSPQVRQLLVPNPVIITPLAKDAAREKGIQIVTKEGRRLI
ncbi:TPA: phosphate propanoyltransferase [Candidatus Poribacteria bacterium]|nr:phosphate propanoyltransferase [Candidatus Poribacteria bacterium]HEX30030.1 phosphate propanoyltransferase [Candidatus Poribacteria bacterium]